ncbi:putative ribonuclease H-like domain-containing protein [Tanacetum coccineum]
MESVSAQVVAAAKLPVLNPGEFELWKMRIEQYFLMTDYALWEVILNGDSPLPTRTVDGVETSVPPTTAEQKLARKNELKARGTLLMALPNEHQLKFNTYKSAKTLMEAIEKRFGGNKESKKVHKTLLKQQYENFNGKSSEGLDQIYDRLQKLISQLEIHGETFLKKITNEAVMTAHSVSAANSKNNSSTLPNVDSLSNVMIYSFFASQECMTPKNQDSRKKETTRRIVPVEETTSNALVSQCDGFGYDWSDQAEEGPTNFVLLAYTSLSSSSLDTESQLNVGTYKAGLESVEARLDVYKKNEVVFKEDIKILKLDIMLRDNALTELRKNLKKLKKERYDLKLTLEKFENSSKNLRKLLDSQICDKFNSGVGYKTSEGYHVVPPPYTGNFMPPKPDLVLADKDEYVFSESTTSVPSAATSEVKTSVSKPKSVSEPLIEDWISDSENENETESKSGQRKPSNAKVEFIKSYEHVKTPRESVKKVENNKQVEYPKKNSQSPMQSSSRAAVSVNIARLINTAYTRPTVNSARPASNVFNRAHSHGNPQLELQEKGVIDSGCSGHMTGNKSYLSDYEEIDGGFVAFSGNSKGGKITRKGKIRIGKLDFEDVYFVKELKFNLFSVSQMCDKKNNILFTDTECVVLSPDFKLLDESQATLDESNLWHRRLGHINFKTMNKLVRGNLVRGLPSKIFENDHTCVACQKGKQHKASSTKDETSEILKAFIIGIENQINHRVKIIRCDNGTEFKNKEMNQFCEMKEIKREFSVARTPRQNRVAERKNRTLIEANRVLVIKPHNKTPYDLFNGRPPTISFMRPFGCPVTILNTLDHLGKLDGKADEGFFIGYSVNSKAFRVFDNRTRIVEETLHITFLENKPNVAGSRPEWLFDIDTLTKFMNYKPVITGNQSNGNAGTKENIGAGQIGKKTVPDQEYILLPLWTSDPSLSKGPKNTEDYAGKKVTEVPETESRVSSKEDDKDDQDLRNEFKSLNGENDVKSTNNINIVSSIVNTASIKDNVVDENIVYGCADELNMSNLEEFLYSDDDEEVGAEANMTNLDTHIPVSPIPTTRIRKGRPVEQIIKDIHSAPQTRRMTKRVTDHVEPKKVIQALTDLSWIEEMQDELLQFKL